MTKVEIPRFYGLPTFFKHVEAHYKIDQEMGVSIQPMFEEDESDKAIVKKMCGKCVGAHLADFYNTKVEFKTLDTSFIPDLARDATVIDTWAQDGDTVCQVKGRHWEDGVSALYLDLKKVKKFYHMYFTPLSIIDKTAVLLKMCGAPPKCFNSVDWPEDIKPSKVFAKMVEMFPLSEYKKDKGIA